MLIILICFYWIVCGFSVWVRTKSKDIVLDFILSMLFGGFLVPVEVVNNVLK